MNEKTDTEKMWQREERRCIRKKHWRKEEKAEIGKKSAKNKYPTCLDA